MSHFSRFKVHGDFFNTLSSKVALVSSACQGCRSRSCRLDHIIRKYRVSCSMSLESEADLHWFQTIAVGSRDARKQTSLPAVLLLSIATNDLLIRTKLLRWLVCCNRLLNKAQKGWRVSNIQSFCNSLPDRPSGIFFSPNTTSQKTNQVCSMSTRIIIIATFYTFLSSPIPFIRHKRCVFCSTGPAKGRRQWVGKRGESLTTPVPAIEKVFHGPYGSKPGSERKVEFDGSVGPLTYYG